MVIIVTKTLVNMTCFELKRVNIYWFCNFEGCWLSYYTVCVLADYANGWCFKAIMVTERFNVIYILLLRQKKNGQLKTISPTIPPYKSNTWHIFSAIYNFNVCKCYLPIYIDQVYIKTSLSSIFPYFSRGVCKQQQLTWIYKWNDIHLTLSLHYYIFIRERC